MDNDDITDVYFIEDIYSYMMTGKISFKDTRGLNELLPLVGNETITIEYGTINGGVRDFYITKSFTFDIIKMGMIESTNDKRRHMAEMFFIQSPHKRLHMEKYSASYKCEKYTDYIRQILAEHVGITSFNEFEDGIEKLQYFYTGMKSPAENIEWLGSRSSGSISGQPGYLLYSSTQAEADTYNFVTLEKLLMNKTLMPPDAGVYTIGAHNEYNINRFLRYKDHRVDKKSLEKLMYYIGLGYDIKRKKFLRNEYTYEEALGKFTCLGNYSLFSVGMDAIIGPTRELTGEVEEEMIMKNLYYGDWIKRYCLQHTVTTMLEGHVDRYCGGMIHVHWPSANDDEIFDKNMSGLFLVKSITHHFSPRNKPVYMQKMILIKNGYDESSGGLTGAGKPNVEAVPELPMSDLYRLPIRGL